MKLSRALIGAAFFVVMALGTQAQMTPMKPAPELKNLDYFVGTWKVEGEMKPGSMGAGTPGGKMTEVEKCEWMEGNFFLVLHDEFKSEHMGDGKGVAYMGYDSYNKVYTYDSFNTQGEAEHSHGTFKDGTWMWDSEMMMDSKHMHTRFTIKEVTPTSYTFKFELSYDEEHWAPIMEGKATKQM